MFSYDFFLSDCLLTSRLNKLILTVPMILTMDNLLHMFLSVSLLHNIFGFFCKNYEGNNGYIAPSYDEEESSSGNKIKMKLKEFHKRYYLRSETQTWLVMMLPPLSSRCFFMAVLHLLRH